MDKLVVFCKSYSKDLRRAKRMAQSVNRFNEDKIPLYMCVPYADLDLFQKHFQKIPCIWLTDEAVLKPCYKVHGQPPKLFPSHLMQQMVKLSFWRMNLCEHYLWIDSDAYFIKPFFFSDFFNEKGVPKLVMHKAKALKRYSQEYNPKVSQDIDKIINDVQTFFGRKGEGFCYWETPLLWSSAVLESLDDYLAKKQMTIFELLYKYPCEMQLYGEYLISSGKYEIVPSEPFFKVFHYLEQFCESQQNGEGEYSLAEHFMGIVIQSNWAGQKTKKKNDLARFKRFLREQRRKLGLLRW